MNGEPVYIDASAAVKLLIPERETTALRRELEGSATVVSSELLEVEMACTLRRRAAAVPSRIPALVRNFVLVPMTSSIRKRAMEAWKPPQRALDALHLATALELALDDLVLVSYDADQIAAAAAEGLAVACPA